MAHHRSAKKRNRQRIQQTERNRHVLTTMRTSIKKFRTAVASGDPKAAQTILAETVRKVDSAAQKGVIHRRAASRTVSRLTLAYNRLATPPKASA